MDKSKIDKKDVIQNEFIKKFHILSLDVVIGAIASGAFAVKIIDVNPGFAWWIALPISVWIIYSLDHLLDSSSVTSQEVTIRKSFFQNYSKGIWKTILFLIALLVFLVLFYLEPIIIKVGLGVGLISTLYLLILYIWSNSKSLFIQKEVYVAAIYTSGIWGGLIALTELNLSIHQWIIIVNFFLLVFCDILIMNFIESESPEGKRPQSFILKYGKQFSYFFIWILLIFIFGTSIVEVIIVPGTKLSFAFKIIMVMTIALLVLLNYREKFQKWPVYRMIGEMVFWIPAIVLLFNK